MKSDNAYLTKDMVERELGIKLKFEDRSPNRVAYNYVSGSERNVTILLSEESAGYQMPGSRSGRGSELIVFLPNAGAHGPAD